MLKKILEGLDKVDPKILEGLDKVDPKILEDFLNERKKQLKNTTRFQELLPS